MQVQGHVAYGVGEIQPDHGADTFAGSCQSLQVEELSGVVSVGGGGDCGVVG
jgi:hypothetical protein